MKRFLIVLVAFFVVGAIASQASAQQCRYGGYSPYGGSYYRSVYRPAPVYRSYYNSPRIYNNYRAYPSYYNSPYRGGSINYYGRGVQVRFGW